jgi:large subunit ribosomal protein L19
MTKIQTFNTLQLKKDLPEINPGDTVKVYQKIKEKDKERIQAFEGVVLARKHGKGITSTITVRRVVAGIGVEKIIPLHSPIVEKIEVIKKSKVKRAKLYYLRTAKGKKARLKRKEFSEILPPEPTVEERPEEIK